MARLPRLPAHACLICEMCKKNCNELTQTAPLPSFTTSAPDVTTKSYHHNAFSNQNSFTLRGRAIIFSLALTLPLPLNVFVANTLTPPFV